MTKPWTNRGLYTLRKKKRW